MSAAEQIRAKIAELQKLSDAATPGPWTVDELSERFIWPSACEGAPDDDIIKIYTRKIGADQSLIAASRNELPKLLRALEVALDRLRNNGEADEEDFAAIVEELK